MLRVEDLRIWTLDCWEAAWSHMESTSSPSCSFNHLKCSTFNSWLVSYRTFLWINSSHWCHASHRLHNRVKLPSWLHLPGLLFCILQVFQKLALTLESWYNGSKSNVLILCWDISFLYLPALLGSVTGRSYLLLKRLLGFVK